MGKVDKFVGCMKGVDGVETAELVSEGKGGDVYMFSVYLPCSEREVEHRPSIDSGRVSVKGYDLDVGVNKMSKRLSHSLQACGVVDRVVNKVKPKVLKDFVEKGDSCFVEESTGLYDKNRFLVTVYLGEGGGE